jgi:hypothetical protein
MAAASIAASKRSENSVNISGQAASAWQAAARHRRRVKSKQQHRRRALGISGGWRQWHLGVTICRHRQLVWHRAGVSA